MHKAIELRISDYIISWLPGIISALLVLAISFALRHLMADHSVLCLIFGALTYVTVGVSGLLMLRIFSKSSILQMR